MGQPEVPVSSLPISQQLHSMEILFMQLVGSCKAPQMCTNPIAAAAPVAAGDVALPDTVVDLDAQFSDYVPSRRHLSPNTDERSKEPRNSLPL